MLCSDMDISDMNLSIAPSMRTIVSTTFINR